MPEGASTKSVFDVAKPGATMADPTSRPVITGNQNTVTDPMMAARNAITDTEPLSTEPAPAMTPEEYAEAAAPLATSEDMTNSASPQTGHRLAHEEAFGGQMSAQSKGKKMLAVLLVVGLLSAVAAAGYFVLAR